MTERKPPGEIARAMFDKGAVPLVRASYADFLKAKVRVDTGSGVHIESARFNPALKDFTRAQARWMLQGGRRALFSSFGLHKTVTQLEVMRLAPVKVPRLIVAPLGVRQEFMRDAARFFTGDHAVDLRFVRTTAEIDDDRPIWLTNYESIREGKLDPTGFCVSLDEASILRGFGGTKTFREFMRLFEGAPGYRFVATATPSPNEYIELLAYAAFLGIMEVSEAKTRFFKRNSEQADKLTLHPHKEREFWMWVASWALFVTKPSDLGFSDEGYDLPPVTVLHGRRGLGVELSRPYWLDSLIFLRAAERETETLTLFDVLAVDKEAA